MKNIKLKSAVVVFIIFLTAIFFIIAGINSLYYKLYIAAFNKKAKIGITVIKENSFWSIRNENQPMLSVFKYIVALKVFDKLEKENISVYTKLSITDKMLTKNLYSPMLKKYRHTPFEITIFDLINFMISYSDNIACDILIDYVGGIDEIQNYIINLGFKNIVISVNEKDMNSDEQKQYCNTASSKDIAKLIKYVNEGNLLSENSIKILNSFMIETTTGTDKLKAGLGNNAIIGHKTGSSSRLSNGIKIADNDAGFIILPDGKVYYIAVFIQDSELSDLENSKLISNISKIVYNHFS